MPKENDLEGQQDQGGRHGGQAGMPKPEESPHSPARDADREKLGKTIGNPTTRKASIEPGSKKT